MQTYKRGIAFVMAVAMMAGMGTGAFATETKTSAEATTSAALNEVRTTLEGNVIVQKVAENGQITVKLDEQIIVLNVGEQTLLIDAQTALPSTIKDIKEGDSLYVYYSAAMTRSLPPQSSAIAIVTNVQKDKSIPRLMTVKEIVSTKDNLISFLNTNEDMIVTVKKDTPITPFKTKQIVNYKDIQPGTKLFVYYDIVLMSYPGQTAATKVVVVSTAPEESKEPMSVVVNGKTVELGKLQIVKQNGNYLVPLKAVSGALGFSLKWDAKTKTASIDNGTVKTDITVGRDAYYKASSKAIGLTQALPLGAGAQIIKGNMYVPVALFDLLLGEGTVTIEGEHITLSTKTK